MKRFFLLSVLALLEPMTASAQDLSGSYVYQSPQGPVLLELQHAGAQVTGVMTGVDGSVNRLDGTFDGQKATGTIATTNGTGWFAAGHLDGKLTLLVADLDPTTGEPNLDDGWRLDFVPAGGAGPQPGTDAGGAGAAAAPDVASNAQPSTSSPLVQEWLGHLRGKKVTYTDSYSSSDASGYGGYSNRWEAFLCGDGSFHYRSRNRMSVDVGGAWGSGSGDDSFSGTWRIIEQGGQAILQYQRSEQGGTAEGQWVALGYQNGETYFDGSRVYVTSDNDLCR